MARRSTSLTSLLPTTSPPPARRTKTLAVVPVDEPLAKPAPRKPAPRVKPEVHPQPAAPVQLSEYEQRVAQMPLEFVQCRDFAHSWRPLSARWMPSFNYFEQVLICGRCKSTKQRQIGRRGQILESHYTYTDGYQMPKGQGRMTGTDRDVLRLASIRAVLAPDTVEE